ncbi:hypothetical protein BURPS1710A_A3047 [Burkholderia pseudomallei 1710a]|uniref:Uncharacterized protein n=1 Tax=Burkholderia pseudomallei 1710a TaxID=320371 RepID=A0A0E1VUE1_BURPE|nr:hypothetical protein BURPS1710A_A3047 [Burkholderia pseudomallei 1710a]
MIRKPLRLPHNTRVRSQEAVISTIFDPYIHGNHQTILI